MKEKIRKRSLPTLTKVQGRFLFLMEHAERHEVLNMTNRKIAAILCALLAAVGSNCVNYYFKYSAFV